LPNAQDFAFSSLAQQRGVLSNDQLRVVLRARRAEGSTEPLAQDLLEQGVLPPRVVAALLRDLAKGSFGCVDCKRRFTYDELSTIPRPGCSARCPTQLDIDARGSGSAHPPLPNETEATILERRPGRATLWRQLSGQPSGPIANTHVDSSWETEATLIERKSSGKETRTDPTERRKPSRRKQKSKKLNDSEETVRDATVLRLPTEERQLGPYELISELGRGANGVIYLAQRPGLARRFAIKTLRPDSPKDEETIRRFQLEAAAASKVNDPGIVSVFDVGQDKGRWYYAMEYCPGRTLEERLQGGPLLIREAVEIVRALARTMHNAHRQGVIHRDLKPANIILEEIRGRPRVTDFGVARDRSLLSSCTAEGIVLGTPNYMAPEQLLGNHDVGPQSDVYSLGVILYECLTGQRPYRAKSPVELARQFTEGLTPPTPTSLRPELPVRLEDIALRALSLDPGRRYRSAAALADDLDGFLGVKTVSRIAGGGPMRWVMIALGLALGVGLSLSTALLWTGDGSGVVSPEELSRLRDALLAYRPRPNLGQLEDELYVVNQNAASPKQKERIKDLLHLLEERKGLEDTVRAVEQAKSYAQARRQMREFRLDPESSLEDMRRVEYARLALYWGAPERALDYAGGPAPADPRLAHERRLLVALARWLQGEREAVNSDLQGLGAEGEDLPCKVAKALYLLTRTNPERDKSLIGLTLEAAEALGEPDYVPLLLGQAWRLALEGRLSEAHALTAGREHPLLAITRVGLTFEGGPTFEEAMDQRRRIDSRSDRGVAYEADLALAMRSGRVSDRQRRDLITRLDVIVEQGLSEDQKARACLWAALLVEEEHTARAYLEDARAISRAALLWAVDTLKFNDPGNYRRYEQRARD